MKEKLPASKRAAALRAAKINSAFIGWLKAMPPAPVDQVSFPNIVAFPTEAIPYVLMTAIAQGASVEDVLRHGMLADTVISLFLELSNDSNEGPIPGLCGLRSKPSLHIQRKAQP